MSKADSIQNKLYKAYGKVAKILGRSFDVMRSSITSDPIKDVNTISTQLVSFSKDDKYNKPQGEGIPLWLCWIDGRLEDLFNIQRGDYLHNWEQNETYLVVSDEPHLTPQALLVNNNISVVTAGYADIGNGFAPGDTDVAVNLPSYITQPSSGDGVIGYIPAGNNAEAGIPDYVIYTYDPERVIKLRDAIIDQYGNRSQVLSVNHTELYTKITTTAYEPQ